MRRWMIVLGVMFAAAPACRAERVKDIVNVVGVRGNPLWGYGVVAGLKGTGDDSDLTKRALANILRRRGLVLTPTELKGENMASVMVTAELPAFARRGAKIDVTASAILGTETSLQGGVLLMTELMGADGEVYAVAQGALTIGGFSATGEKASISKNHTTVGRIAAGATVEKEEVATFVEEGQISLQLRNPDFTTAERIAAGINELYPDSSFAADAGLIRVRVPGTLKRSELTRFLDKIVSLEVEVDYPAVVVVNERTGTIIVGENVGISTVGITHGNLTIITEEKEFVSQAMPFSRGGTTVKTKRTTQKVIEEKARILTVGKKPSVWELARALNAMGLTPRDIISVFEALRDAGALQAELQVR